MRKTIILVLMFFVVSCSYKKIVIQNKIKEDKDEYTATLIMAGDALIHDAIYNDAYIGQNKYDFNYIFSEIATVVKKHDLAFYNQETIIGGKNMGLSTYPRFNSPEEIGDALIKTGFNLISLANNHSLDKGEEGIINSINYWNKKEAFISGTYDSFENRNKYNVRTINNISYTLLSYTTSTNGLKVPEGREYLLNIYDPEIVKNDIEKYKNKVDLILVSMHWGEEYNHEPNTQQKKIAQHLSELGANIVIGHHPHVIQPIEYINNTLVVYSLGNFISAQIGLNKLIGLIVSLDIVKQNINNSTIISIENIKSELIYTYYKDFKNFKLIPYNKLNDNILNDYKNKLNYYNSLVTKNYNKINTNQIFKE